MHYTWSCKVKDVAGINKYCTSLGANPETEKQNNFLSVEVIVGQESDNDLKITVYKGALRTCRWLHVV
jgi:hypothetical protein